MQNKKLININHNIIDPSTVRRLTPVKKTSKTRFGFNIHLTGDENPISVSGKSEQEVRDLKGKVTAEWINASGATVVEIGE